MSLFVKICGLSTPDAVAAAVEAGADAVGYVFAHSPREIAPSVARSLSADLPKSVLRVAVMRHPSSARWAAVLEEFSPDCLQTDAADFEYLQLPDTVQKLPVYRDTPSLDVAALSSESRILFEASHSGVGQTVDAQRACELAGQSEMILAGGLNPDNVAEIVSTVQPWGVDVSSGVEHEGVKDPARIAAFVAAARGRT